MIKSFKDQFTEDIHHNQKTTKTRKFPPELFKIARRKLAMVDYANDLEDLMVPPSNKLEKKKGNLKDYYAIRINDQWRVLFKWDGQNADDVHIKDYH